MAYKVIILYQLYMPSYFLGTFTEYPYLVPINSSQTCLYSATGFAIVAAIVSCLRISQPRPL
ncbi:hypothetical protein, partial [Bacteroides stercoris]|uniref:hypothetical protein n=1 Tax=Bacteroides stercoris TaxID=46506 RepID=UPI001269FFF1